jgi:hypothetical protein
MPFIEISPRIRIWRGDHQNQELSFFEKALASLGLAPKDQSIESVNGREPTLGEIERGIPRNKIGLVEGDLRQNLSTVQKDRGKVIVHRPYPAEIRNLVKGAGQTHEPQTPFRKKKSKKRR